MARYIVKFGGTSVGNLDRIQHAACIVAELAKEGHEIAVVVSAMAGMTNQLFSYANTFCDVSFSPEHDVVVSSGEQITAGLMALALQKYGLDAQSFLAWQATILTDNNYGNATIESIKTSSFDTHFAKKSIPVIAGFQGITADNRITTLGRGGSDTTAVALAASLKADCCYIYTDVEGVYTADPRIVQNARKIDSIHYSHMLELAKHGAKVLHARCVELGMQHDVDLYVLSSFVKTAGTRILNNTDNHNKCAISGITHSLNEVHIHINGESAYISLVLNELSQNNIAIDALVRERLSDACVLESAHFTIGKADFEHAKTLLIAHKATNSFDLLAIDPNIVKISIIGVGIKDQAAEMFVLKILAENHIFVHFSYRLDIKLSLVITNDQMTKAINLLHDALIIR
ncbi:MAG: aspartate kinase [Candidatus Paracaedibacteraceae bacterium]|nr:aspartate kinase [Candidatus Paracaedibacteraceae bacterium]